MWRIQSVPQRNKTLKKKNSLEWLKEKISLSKPKSSKVTPTVETTITSRLRSQIHESTPKAEMEEFSRRQTHVSALGGEDVKSKRHSGVTLRPSGISDIGEWNNFTKKQGIVKEEKHVEYLSLENFEYRVFRNHLEKLMMYPDDMGVEVKRLAEDMVDHKIFSTIDDAVSFCHILDASSVQSGFVEENNIGLLGRDVLVMCDESRQQQENQYTLRTYIRAINEHGIQKAISRVDSKMVGALNQESGASKSSKSSSFFTTSRIKLFFTKLRKSRMCISELISPFVANFMCLFRYGSAEGHLCYSRQDRIQDAV
jgi:hypothetical protein